MRVPELRRKLHLLIAAGHASGMDDVAKMLGRSPVTVRGWVSGGSGGPPDTVPVKNVPAIIVLFRAALPEADDDDVRRLLAGPGDDLEQAISDAPRRSVVDLVARHADRTAGKLFVDETGLSLVRRARETRELYVHELALGQPFRIEFKTNSRATFVLALQKSPSAWGVVPSTISRNDLRIDVPGKAHGAGVEYIVEETEPDLHSFVVAQGALPFASEFTDAWRDSVPLDRTLLQLFASEFERQDAGTRRLFALDVKFAPKS